MTIRITIEGPRGSGKTTVAVEIARLLRSYGMQVLFEGARPHLSKAANEQLCPRMFSEPRTICIVDES